MSERSDDRDVLALIDRAATHTPPLHLDRGAVIARGEQIVRRRRTGVGGMAVAAAVLAGTAWLGLGGGSMLGSPEVSPASVTWEVDEPTTLTLLDGVSRGGNVSPITVEKAPDGATSATFTVDGVEETVEGTRMAGGADLFVGKRATVAVWEQPGGAARSADAFPAPAGWESGEATGGDGIFYLATTDRGYVPQDLIFHDDALNVWTASGLVAETGEVSDGRHTMTVFALPELDLAGYVDEGGVTALEVDGLIASGGTEPWWRGGQDSEFFLARASDEARFLRQVWVELPDETVVDAGDAVPATVVGDAAFAVFSLTEDVVPLDRADHAYTYQWSHDGHTWHARDVDAAEVPAPGPAVGEGGHVTLLGEDYEVGIDERGWPMLLDADGSTFLSLAEDDRTSVADGGVVMWREHWWPWSDRHHVHFYVGWAPPAGAEVVLRSDGEGDRGWIEPEDVVTITGPEGEVTLVSVRAGEADGRSVTGLGLRTEDGVTPVDPEGLR